MEDKSATSPRRPIVTIAIASFNHADFVTETVLSALRQDHDAVEVIVIDDGSSDDSVGRIQRAIAESSDSRHPVRLLTRENRGLVATLNEALATAQGRYLMIIGSDDVLRRDAARVLARELDADPTVGIAGGSYIDIDHRGRHLPARLAPRMSRKELSFEELFLQVDFLPAPGMMIRISDLHEVGGFDPRFGIEDLPLMLKLIDRGKGVLRIDGFASYYRRHGSNMTSDLNRMRRHLDAVRAAFAHRPDFECLMARARELETRTRPEPSPLRRVARRLKRRLLGILRRAWAYG